MRAALVGSSAAALATARVLARRGHVVWSITPRAVDACPEEIVRWVLDEGCGGLRARLQELEPSSVDCLVLMTGSDECNVLAALQGRILGFPRVLLRLRRSVSAACCAGLGLGGALSVERAGPVEICGLLEATPRRRDATPPFRGRALVRIPVLAGEGRDELPGDATVVAVTHQGATRLSPRDHTPETGDVLTVLAPRGGDARQGPRAGGEGGSA